MKISNLFLVVLFFIPSWIFCAQTVFYGTVQFPTKVENPQPLKLLYKGNEYTLQVDRDSKISKRGTFELYDDKNCRELYLLITEAIKLPENPNINYLETSAHHPYRLFHLSKRSRTKEVACLSSSIAGSAPAISLDIVEYWSIEELKSEELDAAGVVQKQISRRIPDNTIILLMNPQYIVKILSEEWHADDAFIKLPTIIFDEDIDEKTLHEMCAKMAFSAVDFRCMHKKITKTTKCNQSRVLSVIDPLNCYTKSVYA